MNTTRKYIYDSPIIDYNHSDQGIDEISIEAKKYSSKSKKIISTYSFNKEGKITSCTKFSSATGWTAYPSSKKPNQPEPKLIFLDTYIYSPLGNLLKIETHNTELNKLVSTKHFMYDKGMIVGEKEPNLEKVFDKNDRGEITKITKTKSAIGGFSMVATMEFHFNDINRITSKTTGISNILNTGSFSFKSVEKFSYNEYNQLSSSTVILEAGERSDIAERKFNYLNKTDDLIESIKFIDYETQRSSIKFKYNADNYLIKSTKKSTGKKKTILEYLRD